MKNSLLLSLFLILSALGFSQLLVKPYLYRPTGIFGATFGQTVGFEIGHSSIEEEDDKWNFSTTASFALLKPRASVFHGYAVEGSTVRPTEEKYYNYPLLTLGFMADFSPFALGHFYPYIGLGGLINFTHFKYDSSGGPINSKESTLGGGVGLKANIGLRYHFNNDCILFLSALRSGWISVAPVGAFAANEYGIGIIYPF